MYVTACGRVCDTYEVGVLHERSCDLCQDIIAEEYEDYPGLYETACGRVCETYEVGVLHERSCDLCQDIIAEEEYMYDEEDEL